MIEPGLDHRIGHGIRIGSKKADSDDRGASEPKASEPDDSYNSNEMSLEPTTRPNLRMEIFTTPETTPEHNIATTTATTTADDEINATTITVTAIRTTSDDEENNNRREAIDNSNERNTIVRFY